MLYLGSVLVFVIVGVAEWQEIICLSRNSGPARAQQEEEKLWTRTDSEIPQKLTLVRLILSYPTLLCFTPLCQCLEYISPSNFEERRLDPETYTLTILHSPLSSSDMAQAASKLTAFTTLYSVSTDHPSQCLLRGLVKKKKRHFLGICPNIGGGVRPNPKTFANPPSYFWHAKFILRC